MVQQHHVDAVCLHGKCHLVSEPGTHLLVICATIGQHTQVIVTHRAEMTRDLRTKEIDQANLLQGA